MNQNKVTPRVAVFIMMLVLMILACQSVGSFNPFATETPTPTNTFTPTPTFTVTPSPTLTHTPTSTPLPTGIVIKEQTGGTSLVIDYDNKYEFLLPPNWAIVFSTQKDLEQAIEQTSEKDPDFAKMAESFKNVDPNVFRLAALNIDRTYISEDSPALLTINAFVDSVTSTMPMSFVTAMIEDSILAGASSTTWDVTNNINNVEVGLVRGAMMISLPNGLSANIQELVISFQSNKKLIVIEIAAPKEFGDQILSPFEGIVDSIKTNIQ
jgi:hypothetical protein